MPEDLRAAVASPSDRPCDNKQPDGPPPRGMVALELAERWREAGPRGLLFLTVSERRAEHLGANLHSLFPDCPVMVLPRWDSLPYDPVGPSREVMGRRASVLRRLAEGEAAPLLIATAEAALQRVPPRDVWHDATWHLHTGAALDPEMLAAFLERTGYALAAVVDEPGEAAIQAQTIDIFPTGALGPVRLELADGLIAAIHAYDPVTQRTGDELTEIALDAATEFLGDGSEAGEGDAAADPWLCHHFAALETIFDYMPEAGIVFETEFDERVALWLEQIREAYDGAIAVPLAGTEAPAADSPAPVRPPPPDRLYCTEAEWQARLRQAQAAPLTGDPAAVPVFATQANPTRAYRDFIASQRAEGRRIVLSAADPRDLATLSRRAAPAAGEPARTVAEWRSVSEAPPGSLLALAADFEAGFLAPDRNAVVIAAADLLGSRARHARPMDLGLDAQARADDARLQIGRPVVHLDHGIGLLSGIETIAEPDGAEQETLRLEYAGGTTLMVPLHDIGAVWAYGAAPEAVALDRLSGEGWRKRRDQTEQAIADAAQGIARAMRERETREAAKLAPPARQYERFAAGFPFALTPDQAEAIEAVLADLGSGHPMDRLLCGDVGFGKTEVALRAVATAVLSGRQAAVVVPTTVLARQHLNTFRRRFAGFGVRVEMLSRLGTPAEARAIKQGLRDGSVGVVIGTQAIAVKDVRFKDLALLVIDEEQRFGARLKEKLRGFAQGLHLLAMSATPIPRTLRRAMIGLQALSTLETPPARRLPIRTVLAPFDPVLLHDALLFERRRGGQSFVVCPRIEDLEPMAARLHDIVPQLRAVIVHGQLPAAALDEAIVGFAEGRGDILLTTNIIETGLDMPRANTIAIWRPDRFGAAQLHQLRGRVGRGRRRGAAYLLTDPESEIAPATQRRLRSVAELNRLGAGFAVSRRDLDLRGAGDVIGEAQAGHIKAIGVELYRYLLDRALAELRSGAVPPHRAEIRLDVPALIPADYVAAPDARINLYARLARLRDLAALDDFADEIEDRFGPAPPATRSLIDCARLGEIACRLGIVQVDAGPAGIALTFAAERAAATRDKLADNGERHWAGDRLVLQRPSSPASRVEAVFAVLTDRELSRAAAG